MRVASRFPGGTSSIPITISLIIPALNEAGSIGAVLAAIPSMDGLEVLVVDGGSADGTAEIARQTGACVLVEARRGYGRACAAGVSAARGEVLIFMDADGADDPSYLPELAGPVLDGAVDLVLGSRLAGMVEPGAMPWQQYVGNRLSSWLIRLRCGQPLTDLSPFRAVSISRLEELEMQEMTYGWPTEMIVKAARRGWRIREIPVVYRRRAAGQSKISGTLRGSLLAAYHILRVICRY